METLASFLNVLDMILIIGSIAVIVVILIIVYRARSKDEDENEEY